MIFNEPRPSQGDVYFQLGPIPVRVHPFFWLAGLITGLSATDGEPKLTLLWIAVVFVSILIHELGHAVLQLAYGQRPRIVLHGFGGLAIGEGPRGAIEQILISLAGPAAGFLFAAILLGMLALSGATLAFVPFWSDGMGGQGWRLNLLVGTLWFDGIEREVLRITVGMLLLVNIFWGLINLLPIYPLDGGRVSRELFTLALPPRQGIIQSLWLSIICAVAVGVGFALAYRSLLNLLLFGYLAWSSYQTLAAYTGRGPSKGWSSW